MGGGSALTFHYQAFPGCEVPRAPGTHCFYSETSGGKEQALGFGVLLCSLSLSQSHLLSGCFLGNRE